MCVCLSVCIVEKKTTGGIDLKLDLMLIHDDPKTPINFGGQRSRSPDFSVRLCTGYLKKLWTDPDEIWWAGWLCDKDKLIRFW